MLKQMILAVCCVGVLVPAIVSAASCPSLTRTLSVGSRGADVAQLQTFLIDQGHLAAGNNTGYFGRVTETAVKKFQCREMQVCSGSASSNGYGSVGPRTRAKIASVCSAAKSATPISPPVTIYTPPSSGGGSGNLQSNPISPPAPMTPPSPTPVPPSTPAPDARPLSSQLFSGAIQLVTPAHYSFGTAVDSSGAVYFNEYNRTRIQKFTPSDGRTVSFLQNTGGLYGIAADSNGNLYVGIDSETNTGKVIRINSSGSQQILISNIRRPRQISVGSDGNVYVALEADNKIVRWNAVTGAVDTVVQGLKTPQGAVEKNGVVYWIEYGSFGPKGEALSPGSIQKKAPDGTVTTIVDGIWRGRGIAVRSDGTLIAASEADEFDQGNSGYIFSVAPGSAPVLLAGGLDYPQFPTVSSSGVVYFTLARDNWLATYTGIPQQGTWPSGQPSRWFQGLVASSGGDSVTLAVANSALLGSIAGNASGVLKGWVKISADQVNVSRVELAYGTNDVPTPGTFALPTLSCLRVSGGACASSVIVERARTGSRWPMDYTTGRELPAPGFAETPVAYWVYIDSDPASLATTRNWSLMAPSLERVLQRHFEGLLRRKASSFAEMNGWFDYIKNGGLACKDISNSFLGTDAWKNQLTSLSDTQAITYLYQGLLGIDPDPAGLQYSLNLRATGEPWSRIAGDIMGTDLYRTRCAEDGK